MRYKRSWVEYVDDERNIGNGIIITLKEGWCFRLDPGCGVRGFDTWREVVEGCTRKSVVHESKNKLSD